MEQSATRDIPKGDQVSAFSSVIRLTRRCSFRPSADVCVELYNSFLDINFEKCPATVWWQHYNPNTFSFSVVVGLVLCTNLCSNRNILILHTPQSNPNPCFRGGGLQGRYLLALVSTETETVNHFQTMEVFLPFTAHRYGDSTCPSHLFMYTESKTVTYTLSNHLHHL